MIPPNTIPYNMPPPILNPVYSQQQGLFMPQQMMAPTNGYFQPPMQNFMQPPLPPNYPPIPLSAMTPHVMPDQLKPLHGQNLNMKSQRYDFLLWKLIIAFLEMPKILDRFRMCT